jgi:[protein-PII] uridylyltransferase
MTTAGARRSAALAAAREESAEEARNGRAGRSALARYTDRMDALVSEIVESACGLAGVPLLVCAHGGYGRRALAPHSDLDLLLVSRGPFDAAAERAVRDIVQPLWDLRLAVGQHVRELADFDRLETDNPDFLLSLLHLRYVAGERSLFEAVAARVERLVAASGPEIAEVLLDRLAARYARFNDTVYQLEPDVKEAPGGLRDIEAARLMHRLVPAPESGADLDRLDDAEELLFRIRSLLHVTARRNGNVLTHDLQELVAERFGCPGDGPEQRVEALMSGYFRRARQVARAVASGRRRLEPAVDAGEPQRVGPYLEIAADGVRFVDPDRVAAMPGIWVEAFRVAVASGCGVSEQARAWIERHVDRYTPDDFVATEGDRQQLRQFFAPRPGLYARLSEMHDCGLLEAIFPEFALVHSRVIRDFYHRYTVDEHSLLAIRTVESLCDPSARPGRERFSAILAEIVEPELVTLALLYHDIGKAGDEAHAEASVRTAEPMLDRLQLPAEARQTVTFLIRHHLRMSRAALRRDPQDPDLIARFASLVRSEEQLKQLTILTLADIDSVSPDTLTPWKEELLWRLYVDTYNRLTFGYADELIEADHAALDVVVAGRPADVSAGELEAFLDGLPRRYLSLFGLATVYRHVRLAREIHPDEVHTSLEQHGGIWELSVVTLDKPYLFSNISGVLSYFGMDIHRAQAMTTPRGLVLDIFECSDAEGFLAQNPAGAAEIQRVLQAVVGGTADVTALLHGKARSLVYRRPRRFAPLVRFDNVHSRRYTVVEIVADDAIGLLHRISRAVADRGCDLDLAIIATEGRKAIDVLHVTRQGRKLSATDQADLGGDLHRLLEGTHEAD